MTTYLCLKCEHLHGWNDDDRIPEVEKHIRYAQEDVWWCPHCGREHRTTDGSILGQPGPRKWVQINEAKLEEVLEIMVEYAPLVRNVIMGPDFLFDLNQPVSLVAKLEAIGAIIPS